MTSSEYRQTGTAMRRLAIPFTLLAGLGALQLYLFPQDTDRFFSWTLRPQLSAMFMGAGFAAGVVLTVLSFRRQPWVVTRLAAIAIFVFVAAMTGATFLHIDLLHLDADPATARLAAWLWTIVYGALTPAMVVLFVLQSREQGSDPPRSHPLAPRLRTALVIEGGAMTAVGLAMFAAPLRVEPIWPWPLTAFSGRALAAWLLSMGAAGIWAYFENDSVRTRPAAITFTVVGALWLIAVARGATELLWSRPSAWIYVGFVLAALLTGVRGWMAVDRG
jgi:hypothetical protein